VAATLTIDEVSEPYGHVMYNAAPAGGGVCQICWTFVDGGWATCYPCGHQPSNIDVVVPITYSVGGGQMHLALRNYKDGPATVRARFTRDILAILWRFLRDHERHVAVASGAAAFDVVANVPSKTSAKDDDRSRMRDILGEHCPLTRDRYRRVLRPTDRSRGERGYEAERYAATQPLDGKAVLLIDDTWATGSSAQAAAYALRAAGARTVAMVVVGRHVNTAYGDHQARIRALPRPFDFGRCAVSTP
jgi:predicted amidophosphoribosyltransferase